MPLDVPASIVMLEDAQNCLRQQLERTRKLSLDIAAPLSAEDMVVQASEDTSPTKWHLAHTTWFFEELVLKAFMADYRVFDERFSFCFNSYYESLGTRHPRAKRGLLTRPNVEEVRNYRAYVDDALFRLVQMPLSKEACDLIEIGINHEQQHQELMLTDILALFAENPLKPAYCTKEMGATPVLSSGVSGEWFLCQGGRQNIGHAGTNFAYDNEGPEHEVFLNPFKIFSKAVTNAQWLDFMEDGGYGKPDLWLADGWAYAKREGWQAPGYWEKAGSSWHQMTLQGLNAIDLESPVCHVSFYEADAFARWAGYRLPTEFEWETASNKYPLLDDDLFDLQNLVPTRRRPTSQQFASGVWEWTASAYLPYPGYKTVPGPLGEYNSKFMCNQIVLRGCSFATPPGHARKTYRNFFYPHQRWQFMGLRLASDN